MRPPPARCYGEPMTAVPLARSHIKPALAERSITILGATGSIGASTIDLIKREPSRYRVEALAANRNGAALAALARELKARFAAVADPAAYAELKEGLAGSGIQAGAGEGAVIEAAQRPADWVMAAITGAAGLKSTLAAAERGTTVALANKECLVCAGTLFMRKAAQAGATVLPVDSEHNALFQAMSGDRREDARRVILTASGGPFRTWSAEEIPAARLDLARVATLHFEASDLDRFPALRVARQALEKGGAAPTIMNAANEVAVAEFLERRLGFGGIAALVEATLEAAESRGLTNDLGSVEDA